MEKPVYKKTLDKYPGLCFTWNTPQKEDTPMHNDILNLIRLMLLVVLILAGVALGHDANTRLDAVQSATTPSVPPEKETPTETPRTESEPHAATGQTTDPTYTAAELEMLALVIYQEAGGDACSDETRRMVGTVVMNRIADNRYPNTMQEVITQRAQYGRLYWTGLVWPQRSSNPGEAHAVARAYTIAEQILRGVRSLPEDVIYQAEFEQGTEVVAYQDGLYFCR